MKTIITIIAMIFGMNSFAQGEKKIYEVSPQPFEIGVGCKVNGPFWNSDQTCVAYHVNCSSLASFVTVTNCGTCCQINWTVFERNVPSNIDNPIQIMVEEGTQLTQDELDQLNQMKTFFQMDVTQEKKFEDSEKIIIYKPGKYTIDHSKMKLTINRTN
ncbi:MAG: hypothetical protein LCH32_06395 [Bacteroidetes bacterium]|nr:hypothetical protein [Bacteroidota bacterium]